MVWLVGIIAFIVGVLIGWWFADRTCKRRFAEAESAWNAKLSAAIESQRTAEADAAAAKDEAAAARQDAAAAREEASAAAAEAEHARQAAAAATEDAAAARREAEAAAAREATALGEAAAAREEAAAATREAEAAALSIQSAPEAPTEAPSAFAPPAPPAVTKPDDLTRIEGIGPKIAELLNADGIVTFAGLAAASRERLVAILEGGGPRYQMHDPTSWPAQADLAAAGRWDELNELQDRLSGGRIE